MSDIDKIRKFGINQAHRTLMECKLQLVSKAYGRFTPIDSKPVGDKERLLDCFTEYDGVLRFWYNVGKNTHMEMIALPDES